MCHGFTKLAQAAANEWPALAFEIFALDGMNILRRNIIFGRSRYKIKDVGPWVPCGPSLPVGYFFTVSSTLVAASAAVIVWVVGLPSSLQVFRV